jgi:hypothetical protein
LAKSADGINAAYPFSLRNEIEAPLYIHKKGTFDAPQALTVFKPRCQLVMVHHWRAPVIIEFPVGQGKKEVFYMLCFSWSPWQTPRPSSIAYGQAFPVVIGLTGSKEETDAAVRENGESIAYVPIYVGWM